MSVLKAIMKHWNSTSSSYDTLHPETEYAQVTDFGQGTIAHLIATTLASTVTACSTDSVFGKLVEKLLTASGVQYNFTNSSAWYICLGSLFGNLIIQGGLAEMANGATTDTVSPPINFNTILTAIPIDLTATKSPAIMGATLATDSISFIADTYAGKYKWIAVGK